MVSRRGFVAGLAAVPLAGCSQAEPTTNTTKATTLTATEIQETGGDTLEPRGPERGKNDIDLSVHEIRGEDRVEFRADGSTYFVPDWATVGSEMIDVAGIAASIYVAKQLGLPPNGLPIRKMSVSQEDRTVPVLVADARASQGQSTDVPQFSFKEFVSITPRSVRIIDLTGDGKETETIPVYAKFRA